MLVKMVFFCLVLILTGANEIATQASSISERIAAASPSGTTMEDSSVTSKATNKVIAFDEIYDAIAIHKKDKLLVAYKVKHLQRFYMKKIEKKVKDELAKEFPNKKITVSSDLKIYLETQKLKEKKTFSEKDMDKVIDLSNEQT